MSDGVSGSAIDRWVRRLRLTSVYAGVYAAGALTPRGHWWAAVLACGPDAVLSHRSAAAAWGLRPTSRPRTDVTVPRSGGRGRAGIDAHQSPISSADRTTLDGLPITTVARGALDLAEVAPQRHVARYLTAAEQRGLFDLDALRDVLDRHPGRRGQRGLRGALAAYAPGAVRSKSELELLALDVIRADGLPVPQVNVLVAGFEVDLHWPDQRVAVELDSRRFHLTVAAFEDDRRRDTELAVLGYRTIRLTWEQLTQRPRWVADRLGMLLASSSNAGRT